MEVLMQLSQIMSTDIQVIPPDATIQFAAERMRQMDVGSLPVGSNDRLIGMVTDRDITIRAVAQGCAPNTPVRQAMSNGATFCYEDDDIEQAMKVMEEKQIRRLPIVNRDKRVVGIVSLGDLALKGVDRRQSGEALEQISRPNGEHAHMAAVH
jgi:CBS domain-containing protein